MKATLKKVWASIWAGITSPDAIKAEKALGIIVATRIAIALGAGTGLVELVTKLIQNA